MRFAGTAVAEGLGGVTAGLEAGEHFEALRAIRRLFPVETLILAEPDSPGTGDGLVGEPDQA